jgi:hypothetical protein
VISQAAPTVTDVIALVFLSAFAPDQGESCASVQEPFPWSLEAVRLRREGQREASGLTVSGLFIFMSAGTGWLAGWLAQDKHGFLLTGSDTSAARPGAVNMRIPSLPQSR